MRRGGRPAARSGRDRPVPTAALLAAVPAAALGLVAGPGPVAGEIVAGAAILLAATLETRPGGRYRELATVPLLAGLGLLSLGVPISLLTELLGAAGGLAVLMGFATGTGRWAGIAGASGVLMVPMLAAAIGLLAAFLLPAPGTVPGVAAALLVAGLLLAGGLYGRPGALAGAAAPS